MADGPDAARGRCSPRCPTGSASAQRVFDATGGLHAAARFTADGELVAFREDVGRHNALDKLVGHALLERELPLSDDGAHGVGPGELRDRAEGGGGGDPDRRARSRRRRASRSTRRDRLGQTLVGFVRDDRANVYTPSRPSSTSSTDKERAATVAWKTSAKIKSPKGTRRDLWVGFKPNGIGETEAEPLPRDG